MTGFEEVRSSAKRLPGALMGREHERGSRVVNEEQQSTGDAV